MNGNMKITLASWGSRFMSYGQCPKNDIRFDVRNFKDRFRGLGSRRSGNHPVVIRGVARHALFREWLSDVKRQISMKMLEIFDRDETDITIAFNCVSGKHRSVACAAIIRYCLSAEGFTNITTVHHTLEEETVECPNVRKRLTIRVLPWTKPQR